MTMILLGFCVGTIGTLIGVGGGFMLIPILLFLFPESSNVWISSVSMWVVTLNASSGSIAYLRQGRVHLRAAVAFILASLPGSVLGVWIGQQVNRATFEMVFGIAIVLYALLLLFKGAPKSHASSITATSKLDRASYLQGALISVFVGFIASFFGIGGGVIHVPLLSQVLGFPVHLAAGTSHFILAITAWFTTAVHLWNGDIHLNEPILWQLGGGVIVGAQVGAHLSHRVSSRVILRILACALLLVGVRLLLR
jgi:uncharacterized membrane protein YfcA